MVAISTGAGNVIVGAAALDEIIAANQEPLDQEGFAEIPGETFEMGSAEGMDNERPVHLVTVSPFRLGRYEVTEADYLRFQASLGARRFAALALGSQNRVIALGSSKEAVKAAIDTWPTIRMGELFPDAGDLSTTGAMMAFLETVGKVVIIDIGIADFSKGFNGTRKPKTASWYQAAVYACLQGGRLPTEAEWERAARGPNGKRYGTASGELSPREANYWTEGSPQKRVDVGSYAPNDYGLYDMAGNVWDWGLDWYGPYSPDAVSNPRGPATGQFKVLRGGSCSDFDPFRLRAVFRDSAGPGLRNDDVGFRFVVPQDFKK